MLLKALKELPLEIIAVFTMFDSGGSTGVLRDEFGVLPPGDVRRGLLALSDGAQADILRKLFAFRFEKEGSSLHDHSFGNLFLLALTSIYGNEVEAIRKASELLNIKGTVLPVSTDNAHVCATLADGTEIRGETNIDVPKHDGNVAIKEIRLEPHATIYPETETAIREADLIVFGPGDLYSSIVPSLVVDGMRTSIRESKAKKVAVCNLMTKWGETTNFKASDMLRELVHYSGIERFDYALCNTGEIDAGVLKRYEEAKQFPMVCDDAAKQYAEHLIAEDFVSEEGDVVRHNADKVAQVLSELA